MRTGLAALRGPGTSRCGRRSASSRVALAAAGLMLLSGCSLLPSAEEPPEEEPTPSTEVTPEGVTLLGEGTTEVDVQAGDTVQVSLPEGSLGVGDYWGVISVADPSVAEAEVAIGEEVYGVAPGTEEPDNTGGTQQFAVEIRGLAPGETTVRVLYCTRTREVSEGCDQSHGTLDEPVDPAEIAVRVG